MGLTFEANGEELFQLKKWCLGVAEVSHLYIYFAGSRMVGLCICDCLQIKGAGLLWEGGGFIPIHALGA